MLFATVSEPTMTVPWPMLMAFAAVLLIALAEPKITVPAPMRALVKLLSVLSVRIDVPVVLVRVTPEMLPDPAIV